MSMKSLWAKIGLGGTWEFNYNSSNITLSYGYHYIVLLISVTQNTLILCITFGSRLCSTSVTTEI